MSYDPLMITIVTAEKFREQYLGRFNMGAAAKKYDKSYLKIITFIT